MTLDDAIVVFGQLTSDDFDSLELDVRDYKRLVNWLTELKLARENAFSDIGLAARTVSENNKLKAENNQLRELVCRYVEYTSQDCCEGCVFKSRCNDSEVDECWQLTEIRGLARELGIEVKE